MDSTLNMLETNCITLLAQHKKKCVEKKTDERFSGLILLSWSITLKRETLMRRQWKWPVFGWPWVSAVQLGRKLKPGSPNPPVWRHCSPFVSVCACPGKRPGPKALQGPRTEVWDSGQRLHEDGAHPQQTEPGQGKDGGPGVQRQPFPTPLSCEETEWTVSHQPAAQRLQTGAGRTDTSQGFVKAVTAWYGWCPERCCQRRWDDAHSGLFLTYLRGNECFSS